MGQSDLCPLEIEVPLSSTRRCTAHRVDDGDRNELAIVHVRRVPDRDVARGWITNGRESQYRQGRIRLHPFCLLKHSGWDVRPVDLLPNALALVI